MDSNARRYCRMALRLMTRAKAVRRAPSKHARITADQKRRVRQLHFSDLTVHEIANATGLPNGGRVSEILGGRR
jgi:hypothetical protein